MLAAALFGLGLLALLFPLLLDDVQRFCSPLHLLLRQFLVVGVCRFVFLLFVGEFSHLYLFEGVGLIVDAASHMVHRTVSALACKTHSKVKKLLPSRLITSKSFRDMI